MDKPVIPESSGPLIWASADEWTELIEHWRSNVQTWLTSGKLNELSRGSLVLHYLMEWCPDRAKQLVDNYLSSDEGTDQLMLSIRHTGTDSIKGQYIEFTPEYLNYFGGIERLRPVARRRLAETTLPHRLKVIYTAIVSGKKVYSIDASIAKY